MKFVLCFLFFYDFYTDYHVVVKFFSGRKCDSVYDQNETSAIVLLANGTQLGTGNVLDLIGNSNPRDTDNIELKYKTYGMAYLACFIASHVLQACFSWKRWSEQLGGSFPKWLKIAHFFLFHMVHRFVQELICYFRLQHEKLRNRKEKIKKAWNEYVKLNHDNHFLVMIEKGIEASPQIIILLYVYALERCQSCSEESSAVGLYVPLLFFGEKPIIYKIGLSFFCVVFPLALSVADEKLKPIKSNADKAEEWSFKKKYLASVPVYGVYELAFAGVRIIWLTGMLIIHPAFLAAWLLLRVAIFSFFTQRVVQSWRCAIITSTIWITIWFQPVGARERNDDRMKQRYRKSMLLQGNYVIATLELLVSCATFYLQGNECLDKLISWQSMGAVVLIAILIATHCLSIIAMLIFYRFIHETALKKNEAASTTPDERLLAADSAF